MAYKCKILVALTEHFMDISIFIDTPVHAISKANDIREEICLPNREYINSH